ncbi:Transposase [Caligus rogercresseyi]|uniref:Transposase n=1 Tax=Caligus rogercresseyi TaxID=217165 RepID=A0A7T8H155_CALRO|nr:Transposase [Caligus rogercresseyi]
MSSFVPTNYDLRTALLFCFHLKKTATESHRILLEAFGEHALGKTQCFEVFKRFKSGDFDTTEMLCVWWDQKGVIYYRLKPGETVNTQRYRQQMTDLDRNTNQDNTSTLRKTGPGNDRVVLLGDSQHTAYSPDLAPSDYYLFASMGHALAEQHFTSYEDVRKWLDDWFASKE